MSANPGGSPVISIVIPCRNHANELSLCLRALEGQECSSPYEVIVVDSASDAAVQMASSAFPDVRLLRSARPLLAGAARNLGVENAFADILGFIDADCIPGPGWVEAALKTVQKGAAMASGPVLDVQPWHLIASADNRLQFVDFPASRPAGSSPYFPGAHFALRKELFTTLGGFSETSPVAQDVQFSVEAAQRHPGGLHFCPEMIVRHHGRGTWTAFLQHQWVFGYSRAEYRLRMNRSLLWLARRPSLGWVVLLRRFGYLLARVVQWNILDFPRFVAQLPFLLIGLAAWTRGFYSGMRAPIPPSC